MELDSSQEVSANELFCKFWIELQLEALNIVGEDIEYDPYLCYHVTWLDATDPLDNGRYNRRIPRGAVRKSLETKESIVIALPTVSLGMSLRHDEALYVHLYLHTRRSGVDAMDQIEQGGAERNLSAGIVRIPLGILLHSAEMGIQGDMEGAHAVHRAPFVDWRLGSKLRDTEGPGLTNEDVSKGRLMFRVWKTQVNVVPRAQQGRSTIGHVMWQRNAPFTPKAAAALEKKVPWAKEQLRKSVALASKVLRNDTRKPYRHTTYSIERQEVQNILCYDPAFIGTEYGIGLMDRLRARYRAVLGTRVGDRPQFRPRVPIMARLHLLEYIGEFGVLPPLYYWATTPFFRKYLMTRQGRDALEVLLNNELQRSGRQNSWFENTIHDQFDDEYIRTQPRPTNDYLQCLKIIIQAACHVAHSAYYKADGRYLRRKGGDATKVERVVIDSFDQDVIAGRSNADDCEGQNLIIVTILEVIGEGMHDWANRYGSTYSTTLYAASRVMDSRVLLFCAATVTSAYVGGAAESGKDARNRAILQEIGILPEIDSKQEREEPPDGHSCSLSIGKAYAGMLLANGNLRDDPGLRELIRGPYLPWQRREPVLMCEGTGPTDPFLLPSEEVFGGVGEDVPAFQEAFLIQQATSFFGEQCEAIRTTCTPRPGPYYTRKQDNPNQRCSPFYRELGDCISLNLFRETPRALHMAFVNPKEQTYGAPIDYILRGALEGDTRGIALQGVYADKESTEIITKKVEPLARTVLNQMPTPAFLEATPFHAGYPEAELTYLAGSNAMPSDMDSFVVVTLFTREAFLARDGARAKIDEKLREWQRDKVIIGHRWYRVRDMPTMDPVIELHLFVSRKTPLPFATDVNDVMLM